MQLFLQQVVDGLASGAIYASLALALVLIFRSTGIVNFAQGEMAMFSTYIAWQFNQWGLPIWAAILSAVLVSLVGGAVIHQLLIRPVEHASHLTIVIVTLGLLVAVNAAAGWIWTFLIKDFPSAFPYRVLSIGDVRFTASSLGIMGVLAVTVLLLALLFQKTKVGLAMRAAASNAESSGLVGIRVGSMLMLGWALAAGLGAISGTMVAPRLFLEPNMMLGVQIYAFAAATLGGFDSPVGAVVGGLTVGVVENLAGTYVDAIGSELKLLVALLIIFGVLLVKPNGLFGKQQVARV